MHKLKLVLFAIFLLPAIGGWAQNIQNAGPIVLPTPPATTQTVTVGTPLTVTSNTSISLMPGFSAPSGSVVQLKIVSASIYPVPPASGVDNPELNWTLSRSFDQNGNLLGENKSFFDLSGQALQTQTKSATTQHVLASQPIYDLYGRAAIQTLAAPINSSTFIYKPDFVRNGSGQRYNTTNFDAGTKLNAPDAVDASQQGTLGWYYSNNNTWDKFVPATTYPYSRADYFDDGTNAVARTAGIGEELRMGKGREAVSNSFPVIQELSNYLAIRNRFFTDATMGQIGQTDLIGASVQNVGKDQQGKWGMSIQDKNGNALMSALPGTWLTVNNTVTLNNLKEEYDLNYSTLNVPLKQIKLVGAGQLLVYQNGTPSYQPSVTGYAVPDITAGNYRFLSDKPFTISYVAANSTTGQTLGCENCHSLIQSGNANGQDYHYLNLPQGGTLNISGGAVQVLDLISNSVLYNNQSAAVTLTAGMFKVVAQSGTPQIGYTTKWSDINYNFYNQKGQLVATIPPNGVQQLITNGIAAYADKNAIPFVTLYEYDQQGRLLAVDNKSESGRSEIIYRKDGKIRFSQNAEQRKNGRFSYTNYDDSGRSIESGEYLPGDITFAAAKTNLALLENTTATGGLTAGSKTDWVRTHYDLPDNSHGQSGYVQDFVDGAVSWTENINSKTWYSYDQEGKVIWVIKWLNGLGYKTIDYTYDYFSNVTSVAYQKNLAAEKFYHYYTYDSDQRLINVQTSRDGTTKLQHANYQYYLHGPVKRVELGDQLQGVDYVYTAQGLLKSINHASGDNAKDPGLDGNNGFAADAFGMQMEYFPNDYSRTGSNIASIATGQTSYYNGNVNGISWQSKKPASVVSTMGAAIQNPTMYTYTYDNKYQLNNATWGTPSFTANNFVAASQFAEKNISYDPNGNIKGLQRTNSAGALSDDFSSYQYQANTNKLNSVGNAAAPTAYASFTYDDLGRLKSENKTGSPFAYYLKYDVTGKITGIYADAALTQLKVGYTYDESGNRISRTDNTGSSPVTSYYVYDSSGNVLSIYAGTTLNEIPVYGSVRLGTYTISSNSYVYELKDNVGSVRVVINRNKNSSGQVDIFTYNDYFSYGSIARSGGTNYRYDYQGAYAEKDPVTGFNNFDLRMYDGRIGRWLSVDPAEQYASPYVGMGNNPVTRSDPDGGADGDPVTVKSTPTGYITSDITITAERIERPTIRQFEPNFWQSWSMSKNWASKTSYGIVNGIYLTGKTLFWPSKNQANNLDGSWATPNERVGAFGNTFALAIPTGKTASVVKTGVEAIAIKEVETATVQLNKIAGDAFRDELAAALEAEGRTVKTEVFKRTPFGARFIDIEVRDATGEILGGIETKVGSSRYTAMQRLKDIWLAVNEGYHVQLVRKP
ncbi:RHS repeat-associated core domain-containing protein [Mucilaginibacter sp. cycad4]|uniref:RHS repeat domain-containing protein n=1 Tax=Mucilaginibacter sp. cycad4 TaxID=3342096 RepID=UPI002AAAC457|nr:RHS repeat-associated core domain-containing protein [Mucilaginibacter gossypii]WPU99896.1 RHS repeat-associated core domain-containing protein [Mucilaginibacter gossypii]